MEHSAIVDLVRRACVQEAPALDADSARIPVSLYTSPAQLERERRLFRTLPIPIAHASELADGRALVRALDGVSLVVTRSADGAARAFKNACRHRGVRILREDCRAKAFVCPYHGWTYAKDGTLIHVPHACAFDDTSRGLVPIQLEERHGVVWATLEGAPDVASFLGEIDEQIASLRLEQHVVGGHVLREQRGNWKMLVEAFLDGYHIRTLHRDTVYRFFHDAKSAADRSGMHVRSASARRAPSTTDASSVPLRELATFNFNVFPSTTIIAHPDWTSLVTVQPLATDRFLWSHLQLIPEAPLTESAKAHFERSFALIEGNVFTNEDLVMCAEAQAGLETGANTELLFGRLESPAVWFHEALAKALATQDQSASVGSESASAQQRKPVE